MNCNNYFKDENICLKWVCKCGHVMGEHSCAKNRSISSWVCLNGKCKCRKEIVVDFTACGIECLFKIKSMEKENDKSTSIKKD